MVSFSYGVKKPISKQAPAEPLVPTLVYNSDEKLRHLSKVLTSRFESIITVPLMVNIPFDPFQTKSGNSFPDRMDVEHMPQPLTGILSNRL